MIITLLVTKLIRNIPLRLEKSKQLCININLQYKTKHFVHVIELKRNDVRLLFYVSSTVEHKFRQLDTAH